MWTSRFFYNDDHLCQIAVQINQVFFHTVTEALAPQCLKFFLLVQQDSFKLSYIHRSRFFAIKIVNKFQLPVFCLKWIIVLPIIVIKINIIVPIWLIYWIMNYLVYWNWGLRGVLRRRARDGLSYCYKSGLMLQGSICRLRVVAFDFKKLCTGVTSL